MGALTCSDTCALEKTCMAGCRLCVSWKARHEEKRRCQAMWHHLVWCVLDGNDGWWRGWDGTQVADGVWTFEQPQKLSGTDVHINVRMTAVRLSSGSLLIYSPIAPTK